MKKTKDEVQLEAIEALDAAGGSGICCMCTGSGKSKIIIDIARRDESLTIDNYSILICVPTEKLRDENWRKEFIKWNAEDLWDECVERTCYVSMPKITGRIFDLVVLDEGHNITEYNSIFFTQNTCKKIVVLTATMPDNTKKLNILQSLGLKIVYTVTLDQAVKWELIAPYNITVVKVQLEKIRKTAKGGTIAKPFSITEFDGYWYLTDQISNIKSQMAILSNNFDSIPASMFQKKQMYERKRMHLVYNLQSKLDAAKFLLSHMSRSRKTLIFAGSIKHAEELCNNSFHSKSPKNSTVYNDFCNDQITWMSCVNAVNEGHDFPNMDTALIVQVNSKSLIMIQRIGRIIRYRSGHIAKIMIIVAKDTIDEEWTKTALSKFDNENITYVNFNELKTLYI